MKNRKVTVLPAWLALLLATVFLGDISISASNKSVKVPIIMYHSVCEQTDNEWVISPAQFEEDLKYLKENGYETVLISDLVSFVNEGVSLPEKPIVLTFDDGYYNNYSQVMPLLKEYDMKMVMAVIGIHAEIWSNSDEVSEAYGHATWEQLKEMSDSGYIELANHTWDMHNQLKRVGCSQIDGEEIQAYADALSADLNQLQTKLGEVTGTRPICLAYPYGRKSEATEAIMRELGFSATLSVEDGLNTLTTGKASCLYNLHRYNRSPSRSVSQILSSIKY